MNIVCKFGMLRVLISDNGWQFNNTLFKDFCEHFGIKTRLEGAEGVWPDELSGGLWAYRMTVRTPTGETPFKLAYGSEAVIPAEVQMVNHKVMRYQD